MNWRGVMPRQSGGKNGALGSGGGRCFTSPRKLLGVTTFASSGRKSGVSVASQELSSGRSQIDLSQSYDGEALDAGIDLDALEMEVDNVESIPTGWFCRRRPAGVTKPAGSWP